MQRLYGFRTGSKQINMGIFTYFSWRKLRTVVYYKSEYYLLLLGEKVEKFVTFAWLLLSVANCS